MSVALQIKIQVYNRELKRKKKADRLFLLNDQPFFINNAVIKRGLN